MSPFVSIWLWHYNLTASTLARVDGHKKEDYNLSPQDWNHLCGSENGRAKMWNSPLSLTIPMPTTELCVIMQQFILSVTKLYTYYCTMQCECTHKMGSPWSRNYITAQHRSVQFPNQFSTQLYKRVTIKKGLAIIKRWNILMPGNSVHINLLTGCR